MTGTRREEVLVSRTGIDVQTDGGKMAGLGLGRDANFVGKGGYMQWRV